jgi:outer membrane immunogenic protein
VKRCVAAIAVIATIGFASCANAANPTYWTGFYVGANAGWSWLDNSDVGVSGSNIVVISQPTTVPFTVPLRPDGFLGGFQVGYNYQFAPQWVFGVEADLDFANIKDSGSVGLPAGPPLVLTTASETIKWLGTLRARFGFLLQPTLLLYTTGGLAFGKVDYSGNIDEFPAIPAGRLFAASASPIKAGWTVGGGFEWEFMPNWSMKAEYLYFNLGSETITGPQTNPVNPAEFATYTFNTRGSIARGGINVRLGP